MSRNLIIIAAALTPLVIVEFYFISYCLRDMKKYPNTQKLSRRAWFWICLLGGSLGGIAYLLAGRDQDR